MLQAIFSKDFFIPKQQAMKAKVTIQSKDYKAPMLALIDLGATNNLLNPYIANCHKLPLSKLPRPRIVRNIDGSKNTIGEVTYDMVLRINYQEEDVDHHFFIIDLGTDDMIIGYPFLEVSNSQLNWKTGKFPGEILAFTPDADKWTPESQQKHADQMS